MIYDFWTLAFAITGAIGSIATAVAVIFLWIQSRQTQQQTGLMDEQIRLTREEMESTLRLWVGMLKLDERYDPLRIEIKNYGKIAAKIVKSRELCSETQIDEEKLYSSVQEVDYNFFIFPDSTGIIRTGINKPAQGSFIGVLILYEYSLNKKGEFGIIARYKIENREFEIIRVFAN